MYLIISHLPRSITFRTALSVWGIVLICFLLLGLVVEYSVKRHFIEQDTDELQVVLKAIDDTLEQENSDIPTLSKQLALSVAGHHGIYFGVFISPDKLVYSNHDTLAEHALTIGTSFQNLSASTLSNAVFEGHEYRLTRLSRQVNNRTYVIILGASLDFLNHFILGFRQTLWLIILTLCIVSAAAIFFFTQLGLRPIHRISQDIRNIGASELDQRLQIQNTPPELKELVCAFNDMLTKVEKGYDTLNNFSADLAHEFRTPLANLSVQTQVALTKTRTNEEYKETLYSCLEEYERLTGMVNDMLWLAKTDNAQLDFVHEPFAIDTEVRSIIDYFADLLDEKEIKLSISLDPVSIDGDKNMIRRALNNIVSNAIRHTPREGSITIQLKTNVQNSREKPRVWLSISNTGEPIPASEINRLFDRFYQVKGARHSGSSGLGLAIVKAIIDLHNGTIRCTSERGKTEFAIQFPVVTSAK